MIPVSGRALNDGQCELSNIPGRLCFGRQAEIMVKPPFMRPEAPTPAIARATMSIFEEVATAQSKDPSSNMKKKLINVHCPAAFSSANKSSLEVRVHGKQAW